MGASSPSPGMMNRPHPHAQQQFIPQHPQQQYLDSPTPAGSASNRGRKRKLTSQNSHLARRPSMHGPHPSHPSQHGGHPQQQQQPGGPPHGFPPGARPPMPPFLGLNLPPSIADELPESIFDDLDRLTPRDIAVARYAKNHELLSMVFDARRIDTLVPAPSPYAEVKAEDLKEKVQKIQEEVVELEKQHEQRLREVRESITGKKTTISSAPAAAAGTGEGSKRRQSGEKVLREDEF